MKKLKKVSMFSVVFCMMFLFSTFVSVIPAKADSVCSALSWRCAEGDGRSCQNWIKLCM
jgi:hypothetical protein